MRLPLILGLGAVRPGRTGRSFRRRRGSEPEIDSARKAKQASNAQVYTLCRLLVAKGPQAPGDRRGCVRYTSRRWRLLVYTGRGRIPPAEPPPGGRTMAAGHTTTRLLVVSKCALSEISDKAHLYTRKAQRPEISERTKSRISGRTLTKKDP